MRTRAPAAFRPSPRSLGALALLGGLNAAWSAFLWRELARSQAGLSPFCALGAPEDCATVWNAPFAQAVGRLTGVPVAGWGLAWSLVAVALPLVLLRKARPALVTAVRLTAAAGVVAVFVLLAVSAAEKRFCSSCALTYVLVAGYAGIALFAWSRAGLPQPKTAAAWAAGATGAAYLLLLTLGPRGRDVVAAATPPLAATAPVVTLAPAGSDPDHALSSFLASLDTRAQQAMADSLGLYRRGPAVGLPSPHALMGPPSAPIRVTEWTDVLCGHCADLHATWQALLPRVPPGSVAIESRHFPLDGECNPLLKSPPRDPVRCLAARVQICLEKEPDAFAIQGALFANQNGLTPEKVYALASSHRPRASLEACVKSAQTQARLEEDLALAARYKPEGTPLVVINGRKAPSYGPFLYAIILARGDASHPAFASLPPPNPQALLP
jgi:protein-disulfide isomerase